jgi:hypothetical protein
MVHTSLPSLKQALKYKRHATEFWAKLDKNEWVPAEKILPNLVTLISTRRQDKLINQQKQQILLALVILHSYGKQFAKINETLHDATEINKLITLIENMVEKFEDKNIKFYSPGSRFEEDKIKQDYDKAKKEISAIKKELNKDTQRYIRALTATPFAIGRGLAVGVASLKILTKCFGAENPVLNLSLAMLFAHISYKASYNMLKDQSVRIARADLFNKKECNLKTVTANIITPPYALVFAFLPVIAAPQMTDALKYATGAITKIEPNYDLDFSQFSTIFGVTLGIISFLTIQRSAAEDSYNFLNKSIEFLNKIWNKIKNFIKEVLLKKQTRPLDDSQRTSAELTENEANLPVDINLKIADKTIAYNLIIFFSTLFLIGGGLARVYSFSYSSRKGFNSNIFHSEDLTNDFINATVISAIPTVIKSAQNMVNSISQLYKKNKKQKNTPLAFIPLDEENPENNQPVNDNLVFVPPKSLYNYWTGSNGKAHIVAVLNGIIGTFPTISEFITAESKLTTPQEWMLAIVGTSCNIVFSYATFTRNIATQSEEEIKADKEALELLKGDQKTWKKLLPSYDKTISIYDFCQIIKSELGYLQPPFTLSNLEIGGRVSNKNSRGAFNLRYKDEAGPSNLFNQANPTSAILKAAEQLNAKTENKEIISPTSQNNIMTLKLPNSPGSMRRRSSPLSLTRSISGFSITEDKITPPGSPSILPSPSPNSPIRIRSSLMNRVGSKEEESTLK